MLSLRFSFSLFIFFGIRRLYLPQLLGLVWFGLGPATAPWLAFPDFLAPPPPTAGLLCNDDKVPPSKLAQKVMAAVPVSSDGTVMNDRSAQPSQSKR